MKKLIYWALLLTPIALRAQQQIITQTAVTQKKPVVTQPVVALTPDQLAQQNMTTAWQYLHSPLKPYNPAKAFGLYLQTAKQGNATAMYAVAMQYESGTGVTRNQTLATSWYKKAALKGYTHAWYTLGLRYKEGRDGDPDYQRAFDCFRKAADGNDPAGFYAQGYMTYKGLGTTQDYPKAVVLFQKGTTAHLSACMYFLGLCYRNGYGLPSNADSARYWLGRSSALGYRFAKDELATSAPENSQDAATLAATIHGANQLITDPATDNAIGQYHNIPQSLPAKEIEGVYTGYLVEYDWSGAHVISTDKLSLNLIYDAGKISGEWTENDNLKVTFDATITPQTLEFGNTAAYAKTDHYSPRQPVQFTFEKASLQMLKKGDSTYLAGNLYLYSPEKSEPARPQYVLLSRTSPARSDDTSRIYFTASNGNHASFSVYPNPCKEIVNVNFNLKESSEVATKVYTTDGKLVYANETTKMEPGSYSLPVRLNTVAGTYIVNLYYGSRQSSTIIIKQ